jgi:hypothetical protein
MLAASSTTAETPTWAVEKPVVRPKKKLGAGQFIADDGVNARVMK